MRYAGRRRVDALDDEHDGDDAEAHQERERVALRDPSDGLGELGQRVVGRDQRQAQHAVELADDHHDRRSGHVAGEQGRDR